MASLFRKRFKCFYCGSRSTQSQKDKVRQWQCRECQAVNYLDENGEITDPPATEASFESRQPQYAQPLSRTQPDRSSDPSIFCSTCLKNQHLLTQTLASYLPPQSHPEYKVYEASYPAYRKSLEERYPQVCEICEPRVIARIRQAGYAAKADHLRRMMEQSRDGRAVRNQRKWRWRSLFVSTGAVAFWTSIAGQLSWNIMGCIADITLPAEDQQPAQLSKALLGSCLDEGRLHRRVQSECALALQPYAGLALVLGVLSLWWNPKLRYKVDGRSGRISGAREYYRIQIVTLVVRFVAWTALQDTSITALNPKLTPAIHTFMAFFTLITTIASRAAIRFSTRPLVSWNDNIESLVPKPNGNIEGPSQSFSNLEASIPQLSQPVQRFPIANLAPARALSPEPYNPPTPPPDLAADFDAMDWTPSHQTLQSSFHISRNQPGPIPAPAPSPFQGQLPPAPKPPSWQLRNPNPQPPEKSAVNPPNPFHTAPTLHPSSSAPQKNSDVTKLADMVMAPPRFFPQSDLQAETGLESLFDKAFSIADSPARAERGSAGKTVGRDIAVNKPLHVLKGIVLAVCFVLWTGSQSFAWPKSTIETVVLGLSFLVAGFSLLDLLMRPMVQWKMTDIFLSLIELVGCVYFALVRAGQFGDPTTFDKAGIYLVAFLAGQEMFGLRFMFGTTKPAVAVRAPAKQIIKRPASPPLMSRSLSSASGDRTPTRSSFISRPMPSEIAYQSPSKKQAQSFLPPTTLQPLDAGFHLLNRPSTFKAPPKPEFPPSLPSSFSTITQPQHLASSFASTERFMSPASTTSVSSTDYASTISESPSPILPPRHRTPGPSITGLSLDDSPIPVKSPAPPRYSLRSRRRQ
ncbi:uncharacterized protein CIMG_04032 [Coccidioides immitis RS]|uniref:Ima1 N-terminal domain-containing protein n=2 Tax=Coccidioides immitis TaxID=5501 RepID=J3KCM8_COCIM|nr:uncharacterized protein CIMG_04032 [Coccidioides immitis RS]EAS33008.3 hypothetical protein CIMG_04032 [Coccidioides immitis RS]KMP08287.1 hypothetical protein CIRG_07968 [Coccidioides immitis RMSCC 2394]TPX19951.1 hypothetical protein DIZ76_017746 [Coccidioides immitis]